MKKIIFFMLFVLGVWQHAIGQTFTSDGLFYNVTSSNPANAGNQNRTACIHNLQTMVLKPISLFTRSITTSNGATCKALV